MDEPLLLVSRQLNQVWLRLHGAQAVALSVSYADEQPESPERWAHTLALAEATHALVGLALDELRAAEAIIARNGGHATHQTNAEGAQDAQQPS